MNDTSETSTPPIPPSGSEGASTATTAPPPPSHDDRIYEKATFAGLPKWTCKASVVRLGAMTAEGQQQWADECGESRARDWWRFREHVLSAHGIPLPEQEPS